MASCSRMYAYELLFSAEVRSLPPRNEGCPSKAVDQSLNLMKSGKQLFYDPHLQLNTV